MTMITLTINGESVTVPPGTTVIEAARRAGYEVPSFCYHPGLSRPATCRMCLVEASSRSKLIASCCAQVQAHEDYNTASATVRENQRTILELMLRHHPIDCAICDQSGDCTLQDHYFAYSLQESRVQSPKIRGPKAIPLSDQILYDSERCILCTRCVRFFDEITRTRELAVIRRGDRVHITTEPGQPLTSPYQMNIVDLCPVGALTSRDFRFKCRAWFLETAASVCDQCARGCNLYIDHHGGKAQRIRPRENRHVNDWWMCDVGRSSVDPHRQARLLEPLIGPKREPRPSAWDDAATVVRRAVMGVHSAQIALILGATVPNETAYAVRRLCAKRLPDARPFLASRPDGRAEDGLLVRNDRNPNRRGLAVLFGELPPVTELPAHLVAGEVTHVVSICAPLQPELADAIVERAEFTVALSAHTDALVSRADVALPVRTHLEHDGTFVSFTGHVQRFCRVVPAPGEAVAGWRAVARLAAAMGVDLDWRSDAEVFSALAADEAEFAHMTHANLADRGRRLVSVTTPFVMGLDTLVHPGEPMRDDD